MEERVPESGKHSVGVARQWCGRWGKVDNCQVGVFAALGRGNRATLVDERLYLPKQWAEDQVRGRRAGVPKQARVLKTKVQLALEMVAHQDEQGVRFAWVGADGFYGQDPAFLRGVDAMGKIFVADVHCDQRTYLDDPQPVLKKKKGKRGRNPTRLAAQTPAVRVDKWGRNSRKRLGRGLRYVTAHAENWWSKCGIVAFGYGMVKNRKPGIGT